MAVVVGVVWTGANVGGEVDRCAVGQAVCAGTGAVDGGVVAQDGGEAVGVVVGASDGAHVPDAQLHKDAPCT